MTKRVTRTALPVQRGTVGTMWSLYQRDVREAARHAADRAANRPVSFNAGRTAPEDYGRWYSAAVAVLDRMRVT